jgi:hypothetical protein
MVTPLRSSLYIVVVWALRSLAIDRRRITVPTVTAIRYGVFECKACQESDAETCGDHCFMSWPDELPPLGDEWWPACKCCSGPASLVTPLLTIA